MLASMFIGAAGFLLIFVANKGLISLDPVSTIKEGGKGREQGYEGGKKGGRYE